MKKPLPIVEVVLEKIVGGGQAIGTLSDGRKIFVWGGLPGEKVSVQITKKKSKMAEGVVIEVLEASKNRIIPIDSESFLSTSPWQIMDFEFEQQCKADLISDAFKLHHIEIPEKIEVYSDGKQFGYRNKVEFSWYFNKDTSQIDLAFFKRGSHGKLPVNGTSLATDEINRAAINIRDLLRSDDNIGGFDLKTLLIRSSKDGKIAAQLYVKNPNFRMFTLEEIESLNIDSFELIFSNPESPASVITERIQDWGRLKLSDKLIDNEFDYAVEGFFQINLPVYEQALIDMKKWVISEKPLIDLYSGVGTIGLTIGNENTTLVEINEFAHREMENNIKKLGKHMQAKAVLAPSEKALDYINENSIVIVDPPRAGMHDDLVYKLIDTMPERIIYLSCNPVTQARDVQKLLEKYEIKFCRGYNFFPRTPHIENLVILELK